MNPAHAVVAVLLVILGAPPLAGQAGEDLRPRSSASRVLNRAAAGTEVTRAPAERALDAAERRLRQEMQDSEPSLAGHLAAGILLGAVAGTAVGGWLGYDNEVDGGPDTAYGPEVPPDDDFMDEDALMGGIVGGVIGGGLGVTIYRAKLP